MKKYIELFQPSLLDLKDCISYIKRLIKMILKKSMLMLWILNLFALVAVGYTWLQFIKISEEKVTQQKMISITQKYNWVNFS